MTGPIPSRTPTHERRPAKNEPEFDKLAIVARRERSNAVIYDPARIAPVSVSCAETGVQERNLVTKPILRIQRVRPRQQAQKPCLKHGPAQITHFAAKPILPLIGPADMLSTMTELKDLVQPSLGPTHPTNAPVTLSLGLPSPTLHVTGISHIRTIQSIETNSVT